MYSLSLHKIIITILTVMLLQPCTLLADDIDGKPFTLEKAIEVATTNNVLIKEAMENHKAAIEEERAVKKDFLPKASASYSYTRLKDTPFVVFGISELEVGPKDNFHWDLSLTQPVFTGFVLSTKLKMAKLGIELKDVERKQAILDVVKEVKVAYFRILLAKKILMVANEAVGQLESHVNNAEKFYKHGMIPYNDLLKSKVALADVIQNKVRVEGQVEMAISSFNTLLRMDINTEIDVEDVLDVVPRLFDIDALMEEAIEKRPELKSLRLVFQQTDYVIQLAKSSYYPQIAFVAGYEQNGDNPAATNNDYGNFNNAHITVQATWTFFEWGKKRTEVRKYRHDKLSLREKINGIEDSIRLEVKNAFMNLQVAEKNIHTARESLVHAKENYRITNLQYQQQMTTSTEVLDARTFLTQAETNYYGALYGYMVSLAELERATGRK
ncbi:MAG: TolC family protein [Thermodesulfobacteriota bacterium]|nr:TolC family protein [Thermodesulfobacteriota bacterium]